MKKEFHYQVDMKAKTLWMFSMYHSNRGLYGAFNLIFTLAALYLIVFRWGIMDTGIRVVAIVCALLFTVWQPMLLYTKAARQARLPVMQMPLELDFNEEGIRVAQGGQQQEVAWDLVGRVITLPFLVIFYMDSVHAYLLPMKTVGADKDELLACLKTHVPKERLKRF